MAIRYDENTQVRAVRLVRGHRDDYDSQWAVIKAISGRLGMNRETLRRWVRQAEVDAGQAAGTSSEEKRELWDTTIAEILAGYFEPDAEGKRPPELLYGSLKMWAHL